MVRIVSAAPTAQRSSRTSVGWRLPLPRDVGCVNNGHAPGPPGQPQPEDAGTCSCAPIRGRRLSRRRELSRDYEPSIFEHTLSLLGSDREHAVMVGDSLARDVDGATAAGLQAVWVNRSGSPLPGERPGLVAITTLHDLPRALQLLPS
ncbi:MAG: HAD family hydrolase [Solirubrobacteraceae bacterium]